MKRHFSVYLDIVRLLAALMVLLCHSNMRNIVAQPLPAANWDHTAVIIFFVLSGYVIAYITDCKENTLHEYAASRLTRIYSLAIPALVLSLVLDYLGEPLGPHFYSDKTTHDYALLRFISSLAFLNEIWSISITSYSNVPYWSLNYEMWYYILFAIWAFFQGRQRNLLLLGVVLLLGYKILLLAPVWLAGVVLHRWERPKNLGVGPAFVLWAASIAGLLIWQHFQMTYVVSNVLKEMVGAQVFIELAYSRFFLADYCICLLVAINFAAMRQLSSVFGPLLLMVEKPVKFLAGFTFSIYILQQPLILFWAAVIDGSPQGYAFYLAVMGCTFASIFALGWLIERRRFVLRAWLMARMKQLAMGSPALARAFARQARY